MRYGGLLLLLLLLGWGANFLNALGEKCDKINKDIFFIY